MAPKAIDLEEWPMIMKNERHGELVASFQNGDSQKFALHGVLLRPKLILLTEKMSKNDKAQDEMEFGICNVDKARSIKIFLSNITEVSANWALNYVKFPKKQTISKYTTTQWEEENLEKVDDPDVFEFSLAQVSLQFQADINTIFYRAPSKESHCRSGKYQKASLHPQFPRTNTRDNTCRRRSRSTSDPRRTASISPNSDLPSKMASPVM